MMREILFRGKRIDNGEWVEGYLIHDKHDGLYRIAIKLEYSTGTYIVTGFAPRVNVETIGQYTGLTDKNGKRIFEGDVIVSCSERRLSNKPAKVEFSPLSGYWMCNPKREPAVIGNIHDDPELLKGAD